MYKVFINDKMICFTDKQIKNSEITDGLVLNFFDTKLAIIIVDLLEKDSKLENLYISVDDVDEAFDIFKSHFKLIKAAGGIVKNKEGKHLFIHRLGKWDLPKGKIEKNEGLEEAAIREVEEECGILGIEVNRLLKETYHIYDINEKVVLKQTYWFDMTTDYKGDLKPQLEEGIIEVRWMENKEIKEEVINNTYQSIRDLLESTVL